MKQLILFITTTFLLTSVAFAQSSDDPIKKPLYHPSADAKTEIAEAVEQAKSEGKHVLLQLGGNWCGWCILFHDKVQANDTLRTAMEENFVVRHVNYSAENKNEEVFASLGYPQRFGFPVFIILDGEGNRLHTQNSAYLEQGKGHSTKKVLEFFTHWSPKAIQAEQYEND